MGKLGTFIVIVVVIALFTAGVLYFINASNSGGAITPAGTASGTSSGTAPTLVLNAPSGTESVSDGTISFTVPPDFALATSSQQISVRSYIPPCDAGFAYCLYYTGMAYQGTNFDSAGIRIEKRTDLMTTNTCLTTPPTGYANFTPTSTTADNYSLSEFTPLGDAGAGHSAVDTLYRVEYNGACYEFETRIGQTQFANYPSGTIQQFTATDQTALRSEMQNILDTITLSSGETVAFPD